MAGEWIKMRLDLASDPAVIRIRRATGLDADSVVGKLHRLWSWADAHTADGFAAGLDAEWVDELVGVQGFAAVMADAGWLQIDDAGIRLANFDRHNGQTAKVRALRKTRMERFRGAARATDAPLEEEKKKNKKREEEDIPAAPVPTSKPAARSPAKALGVDWTAEAGWQGITPADRQEWATAFPGAVLEQELAKATAWLRANPKRAGRRNWRRFIVNWLQRCQDKGGTVREPGRRPEDDGRRQSLERTAAAFAGARPGQYRRPAEVVALADQLRLKEEDR